MISCPTFFWPIGIMATGAILMYFFVRILNFRNQIIAALTALIFIAALIALWVPSLTPDLMESVGGTSVSGTGAPRFDYGAQIISSVALALSALVSAYSADYLKSDDRFKHYYPLLLLMMTGLFGMLFSVDLFSAYLFCELMSICAYALVAYQKNARDAIEAGYKYLVMGSVGTMLFLMGIALIFMSTGNVNLEAIRGQVGILNGAGIICLFVGLSVKCAIVPVHTWLPDAHGLAPSGVSALLSGVIVQSVLYLLVKLCLLLGVDAVFLGTLLIVLAAANISVGNIMALVQTHTKRLLAYSTIAQTGYMMACLGTGIRNGATIPLQTFFFLVILHAMSKALSFLSNGIFELSYGATEITDLKANARKSSFTANFFGLALVSLSSLPPFAGFTGKWLVLTSLIENSDTLTIVLMIIFLAASVIALGYYLPLIVAMFRKKGRTAGDLEASGTDKKISGWAAIPMICLGLVIVLMGITPQFFLTLSTEAVEYLLFLVIT